MLILTPMLCMVSDFLGKAKFRKPLVARPTEWRTKHKYRERDAMGTQVHMQVAVEQDASFHIHR